MPKYPKPIPLPDFVVTHHKTRYRTLSRAAKQGILLRFVIILAEVAGFYFYHSHALLADAFSSLLDVASSFCLLWCLKKAHQPPDRDHPLGHGRFEPIAGLQIGLLLAFLGAFVVFQQGVSLFRYEGHETVNSHGIFIPLIAIALLELCYQRGKKAAKKAKSAALMADAIHYRLDGIGTLLATITLGIASYLPLHGAVIDRIGAMVIAGMMIVIGLMASKKNLHQLVDEVPDQFYFEQVKEAALSVKGILATEKILIQIFGPDAQVSIDVEVDPKLSVEKGHALLSRCVLQFKKSGHRCAM